MPQNANDTLQVLRFELNCLELGGLERDHPLQEVRSPFKETAACMNFSNPLGAHACAECPLFQFVPEEKRAEEVPCHHIPLNDDGETVAQLIATDRRRMVTELERWLRKTIAQLESAPGGNA